MGRAGWTKRIHLVVLAILASGSLGTLIWVQPRWTWADIGVCILIGVFYTLADMHCVVITLRGWVGPYISDPTRPRKIYLTVYEAPFIFAIVVAGPAGVLPILLATVLVTRVIERKWWLEVFFNVTHRAMDYLVTFALYSALNPPDQLPFSGPVGALSLCMLMIFVPLWNLVTFSLLISVRSGRPFRQIWREGITPTAWVGALPLGMGGLAGVVWMLDPWLILPALLPIFLAYRALHAVARWTEEHAQVQRLAQELQTANTELQALNTALEARVAERTAEIERLLQLRVTETSAAVHDLKNRVSSVETTADVMMMLLPPATASSPIAQEVYTRLKEAFYGLRTLLGEVLDAALMERGQLQVRPEPLALDEVVQAVQRQLTARYSALRCTLTIERPPTCIWVWCDRVRLERVIYNLLDNAAKYAADYAEHRSEDAGDTLNHHPAVRVWFELHDEQALCHIADNGPGIAPDDLQRLGERGVRLGQDPTRTEGSGLGLNFCFRALALNRGRLTIASRGCGTGSTFTIWLPLSGVPPIEPAQLAADPYPTAVAS